MVILVCKIILTNHGYLIFGDRIVQNTCLSVRPSSSIELHAKQPSLEVDLILCELMWTMFG